MLGFYHFTVHVCVQAKVCVCACLRVILVEVWWYWSLEGGGQGACDRQRSHLTLHVLNRLKDFFPDCRFHCCLQQSEHL